MAKGAFPAVLHCYTGGAELARRGLALGLYVSFSGILTFKKSDALREVAPACRSTGCWWRPTRRIWRPASIRGKRNEPAYVVETAAALAKVKGVSPAELAQATTENFFRLYSKAPRAAVGRMSTALHAPGQRLLRRRAARRPVWGACDPTNPKNRRRRCALLVERFGKGGRTAVLVDTPPDMREQLLDARVETLDGVLFTHDHADHTHGIDDLRGVFFNMQAPRDVYCRRATRATLEAASTTASRSSRARSTRPSCRRTTSPARAGAHRGRGRGDRGRADPAGARRHRLARLPLRQRRLLARHRRHSGSSLPLLQGLDLWIVDALRPMPHPSHFSVQAGAEWIERVGAKRAILTHMTVELDYAALQPPAAGARGAGLRRHGGGGGVRCVCRVQ